MTPADLLTYDGTTQPIAEWALDYGIPADLIIERLKQGQSIEAAITTMMPFAPEKPRHDGRAHVYTHDGETLTIREWAERTGIARATLTQRLARGMPIAEAIDKDFNMQRERPYSHNGETKTLAEWARHAGIGYDTLLYRVSKLGMTIGDAIAMRKHSRPHGQKPKLKPSATRIKPTRTPSVSPGKPENIVITVGGLRIEISTIGRGLGLNFLPSKGTGGGSTARECAQIDFSSEAP